MEKVWKIRKDAIAGDVKPQFDQDVSVCASKMAEQVKKDVEGSKPLEEKEVRYNFIILGENFWEGEINKSNH